MDWEQDNPMSSPLKTPKKLKLICSEAIAVYLATKSVPAIELYFPDPINPDINLGNTSPDVLLKELLALKNWYWKETKSWLGPSNSILRVFISGSFQDILTFLEFPTIRRERQVFNAFIFQILFSHSTGSYPTKCCFPVTHLTKNLDTFLYRLGPFELLTIHDSCLMFGVANPYPVLLKNSPSLKHIFISSNSSSGVLESLRKYCKNIEVFEMEINEIEPIEEVENLLCRTFFDDINMTELLEKANAGEDVLRSFPKLRELYFHSFENYKSISCTLMFLLQHFYPGIRTRWRSNMWKVKNLLFCKCSASHYPSFVRGKKFQLDYIDTRLSRISLLDSPSTPSPKFFKTTYIQIIDRPIDLTRRNLTIEELMKYYDCNNLVFRFIITDEYVTESINRIWQDLNELYLHTILMRNGHVWRFLTIISKCVNLKVLSVEVVLESSADCECEKFDFQLLHLERVCLGVFSSNYQQGMTTKFWIPREFQSSCGDAGVGTTARLEKLNDVNNRSSSSTSITSGEDGSMSTVFNALDQRCSENRRHQEHSNDPCTCHNFSHENRFLTRNKLVDALDVVEEKMCLISPARNGRSDIIEFENICVRYIGHHMLSIIDIEARYSYYKLNEVSRIAKIKRDFSGPNDLPIKFFEIQALHIKLSEGTFRNGQFGYGFYGNGSHGVGYYGYGIDGFGFYGHGVQGYGFYGYGASGFGFYGTNIHTYRTEFHGHGKSGYGLYSMNVNRGYTYYINEIKDVLSSEYCPSKKCSDTVFDASTRHALKYKMNEFTEQEDTGYCDPTEAEDMITRLLLWIVSKCPNLKTLELPCMRLRDLIWLSQRGYLRRVCTLKISNTFSLEVKRILEDMPSLSLLIIDGLNGMSNFNKYKEFFRTTGLKVEFYDTRLVSPRSSILDFDKTRFKL